MTNLSVMEETVAGGAGMRWSPQQESIFDWFRSGAGNLVVRARAGTGKTTTILEGVGHAPEERILLCAFNKRIATELQRKLANPRAEAKTLHSVGFGIVQQNWSSVGVDAKGKRAWDLAARAAGNAAADVMVSLVAKLSTLAKEMAPFAEHAEELVPIAEDFDCEPDADWEKRGYSTRGIAEWALKAMGLARERTDLITFSDMLYLPLVHGWVCGRWDLVVVDECQDMNRAQLLLAERSCSRGGRIAVVGDDRQAIYGFRGADSNSLDRLRDAYDAKELPLTVTYRCPRKIVEIAQLLVPDYSAAPTAPEGTVLESRFGDLAEMVAPGDFVLSRKNAPLVRTCLSILRRGVRANIEGRDIGRGLLAIVKQLRAGSIPGFLEALERWEEAEAARARESRREGKEADVRDRAETLRFLAEGLPGVPALEKRIDSLFTENGEVTPQRVTCSTVHKAKGLEAPRVFVLRDTLYAGGRKDKLEEKNIEYVAVTRAKSTLVWINGLE